MYVNSGETPQEFLSNVIKRTRLRLFAQIFGIAFVQAILVFYFPGMLIQSVRIAAREKCDTTTFEGFTGSERNKWLCRGESEVHFWRRALFAWLITTSTAYVFAPGGFAHAAEVGFVYLYFLNQNLQCWFVLNSSARYLPFSAEWQGSLTQ